MSDPKSNEPIHPLPIGTLGTFNGLVGYEVEGQWRIVECKELNSHLMYVVENTAKGWTQGLRMTPVGNFTPKAVISKKLIANEVLSAIYDGYKYSQESLDLLARYHIEQVDAICEAVEAELLHSIGPTLTAALAAVRAKAREVGHG